MYVFPRFNKTCETKAFLNNFFSYIVAINISDTNNKKKKACDSVNYNEIICCYYSLMF